MVLDSGYAAHTLFHELAHSLGFTDEDVVEALAVFVKGEVEIPELPATMKAAEDRLWGSGCIVQVRDRIGS